MNAVIIHESRGRMRLQCRLKQKEMSLHQADLLEAWFQQQSWTSRVTVHERTGCVILYYTGNRDQVLQAVRRFSWEQESSGASTRPSVCRLTAAACSTASLRKSWWEKRH